MMVQQFEPLGPTDLPAGALDALEDGVCSVDQAWRITSWNRAAEKLFAISRSAAVGATLWSLLPQLSGSPIEAMLRRVSKEGVAARVAGLYPAGAEGRMLSVRAAPVPGGMLLEMRDAATPHRLFEPSASLLETVQSGLVAVDADWRILYLNEAAESLLRTPRERVAGESLWLVLNEAPPVLVDALHDARRDWHRRHLKEVQPHGGPLQGRSFEVWVVPMEDEILSILFRDVTSQVEREKELARLAREALEANRAKSRFFAAISHELRTPLNAIVGYTHLLGTETYGTMPPQAVRAAERASVCAEHLSRLVDDVLLLTTVEVGRLPIFPADLDLAGFLTRVLEPFRHQTEAKGLTFELQIPDGLPRIETDAQRLRQLLVALLSNAVKFTCTGSVGVRVAPLLNGSRAARRDEISLFPEPQIEIEVVDTGPGVAPEDQQRIFDAFEQVGDAARADSMARGTGLGLTIATGLAQLLQGKLALAETSSRGSVFRVTLPVSFQRSQS